MGNNKLFPKGFREGATFLLKLYLLREYGTAPNTLTVDLPDDDTRKERELLKSGFIPATYKFDEDEE